MNPSVAVIVFPGMNCETESVRALIRNGIHADIFRWNAVPRSDALISSIGGYFLPGGFSYEDRGRSGMIVARDPLIGFLREESRKGKVIIGHCNGAQILVESGMIPFGEHLTMALAKNRMLSDGRLGLDFINEWIWMKPSCKKDRCAVSDCGIMQVPIAHGEGRFTTRDPDLITELQKNDQIVFQYCDKEGTVSEATNPNGSIESIAGICNPEGNVIALMPHPERTENGDAYFRSFKRWLERGPVRATFQVPASAFEAMAGKQNLKLQNAKHGASVEIFIDTIITNNEERSLEKLLKRYVPNITLKQLRYITCDNPQKYLSHISQFNPNKEVAHVRQKGEKLDILDGIVLIRWDDSNSPSGLRGAREGICYVCNGVDEKDLEKREIQEIFVNPHAGSLQKLS